MELRYGSTSNYLETNLLDSKYVWGVKRALDFSSGTGSNYYWYNIEPSGCSNNDPSSRYAYDVLSTLHTGTVYSEVSNQLSTMKANGHDVLRIPFSYRHCAKLPVGQTGYENSAECPTRFFNSSVASDLGFLPSIALDNLADLLELVKQKGINQVILAGLPIGPVSSAKAWTSFNEDAYQENKSVLFSTRDFVENASLSRNFPAIVWELENELVPASNDPDLGVRLQYAQRLWEDWVSEYGTADSLGYSVIATNSWHVNNRMQYLDDIYEIDLPDFIDIHIYSGCDAADYPSALSCENEQEVLQSADSLLRSLPGFEDIPIAIGEMWYNDSDGANSIATAMADRSSQEIGRNLIYVNQWPRKRIHRSISNCFQEPPYTHSALGPLP